MLATSCKEIIHEKPQLFSINFIQGTSGIKFYLCVNAHLTNLAGTIYGTV